MKFEKVHEIIRVDLAGEKGAIEIYKGQLAVIRDKRLRKDIKLMLKKKRNILKNLVNLLVKYKVRPTLRSIMEVRSI